MKDTEIWLPIKGYTGLYEISDQGRVRSLNYKRTGRTQVLKPLMIRSGYLQVMLYKDGKSKPYLVHRLVAEAFLANAEDLPEVNHLDECKTHNAVSNLEWCDRSHNINYGTRNARISKPVQQFSMDGRLINTWSSMMEAERVTGVNQGNISSCCNGKLPTAGRFVWRYAE